VRAYWHDRLDVVAPGSFRIGIAWIGRKEHMYDARRSLSFELIQPLLNDTRITWVNLQKRLRGEMPPAVPEGVDWLDWTGELADFADTAALVANLDLVLSIDSAMVHLGGALGVPVWMMDRFDNEWRWLHHREDSPWYPSLRIFRQQTFGDWQGVINRVAHELTAMQMPARTAPPAPRLASQPASQQQAAPAQAAPSKTTTVPAGQPGNTLTPQQAAQLAGQLQAAGRLQEAEQVLRQILQVDARNGHALHLLGVVYYQSGRQQEALQLIEQAISYAPDVALFHSNLAEMYRQQGHVDDAIRHGRRATEIDPGMASAFSNLGIAYYDARDYDAAEACHHKALELDPNQLQSLNNLGSIQRMRKDLTAAAEWYRKVLAVNPDYVESLSNLGAVLVEDGHAKKALPLLEKAIVLAPDYVEALCNLGLAYIKEIRLDEAAALLERSLKLRPDYPEALIGMGRVLNEQNRTVEARQYFDRVVEVAPDKPEAWCQLAALATEMGEPDRAEQAFNKALETDPEMADAIAGIGNLRLESGKLDEAVELLERAIEIKPDSLGARFQLAQARKVKLGDDNLAVLEGMQSEYEDWEDDKRVAYHYALGKAYDDLKQYDQAFPHFLEGARIKRSRINYDADEDATISQRIISNFTKARFNQLRGAGNPSNLPIFVLGMPRSGTTLTEQIIASHPQVFGAGELPELMNIVQHLESEQVQLSIPDIIGLIEQSDLTRWGEEYVRSVSARASGNPQRITDKMPANYYALGLIPLMLPNAKIVHVKRNPVDTCVSCFTRLFQRHQDATYDLAELGRHYASYARLMEHWRKVLPEDSFIEVQYEDIVADMETQARRLIDWCGLEWDDACLEFHKNKRSIRTASVTQVRQPIYTSSVERWRNYEQFLGPLLEALGEFRPN
jgi:tetratricopeptide (TPR) repeat protein